MATTSEVVAQDDSRFVCPHFQSTQRAHAMHYRYIRLPSCCCYCFRSRLRFSSYWLQRSEKNTVSYQGGRKYKGKIIKRWPQRVQPYLTFTTKLTSVSDFYKYNFSYSWYQFNLRLWKQVHRRPRPVTKTRRKHQQQQKRHRICIVNCVPDKLAKKKTKQKSTQGINLWFAAAVPYFFAPSSRGVTQAEGVRCGGMGS